MATKIITMNEDDEDGYTYHNSDEEYGGGDRCGDRCADRCGDRCEIGSDQDQEQDQEQEYGQEEDYPEFYANLEVVGDNEVTNKNPKTTSKIKNKPRSMSIDSIDSEQAKRPNFKCGSCKKSFLLDKNQKMIRCSYCGYRILFKLRTRNYITFKTE
jgi:DNA-directed RNA polymerase subunit RPC12/RpoP